jgi:DNA-binding protein YbaB
VGEADEGRIQVTVVDERLKTVRVEPRLLRSSPESLRVHLIEAVNAALADYRARLDESREVPDFDLREIATDLRKANEQFEHDMRRNMAEAAETVAELRRSGVAVADLPTVEFGDLIDDLTDLLEKANDGQADGEELTGTGEAPRGTVRAVCVPGVRLESLKVGSPALRGTLELERDVVTAVNAALDDLAAKTRDRQAETKVDPEALKRELSQLRERNLARLQSYYRALSDVIVGIEPQR